MVGRTGFEPVTSSVSGNAIYRSRFRIFALRYKTPSMLVRWCQSLQPAIVTQLVTQAVCHRARSRGAPAPTIGL
jgi:hypothetical protein